MSSAGFTVKEIVSEMRDEQRKLIENTAAMAEHLKTLNGKVVAHERRMQKLEESGAETKAQLAKYAGAAAVLLLVLDVALKVLL